MMQTPVLIRKKFLSITKSQNKTGVMNRSRAYCQELLACLGSNIVNFIRKATTQRTNMQLSLVDSLVTRCILIR